MKNILIILIPLLFLTCESSTLGVDENQGISYFDCLAFGWQAFFDEDYDLALNYFETAFLATDADYYNSAYSSIGWLNLFKANRVIGNSSDVEELRSVAKEQLLYDADQAYAIESYEEKCPYYEFCCEDCFVKENQLGLLIYDIESFFYSENQNQEILCQDIDNDNICESGLIYDLKQFINNNSNYDFMNGKPTGSNGELLNLTIDNVIMYLAQNYLRINEYQQACEELFEANLACGINNCDDISVNVILNCVQGNFPF